MNRVNTATKTALVIALVIVIVSLLLFDGAAMTGTMMGGGMMGNGAMGGVSWMWMPTLLIVGLEVLLAWGIFGQKK